ncbi:MAG: hypothetical protein EKK57_08330 [Proteobacteria bacterium]|nr:MAG: hypothetical protein EKK57_08330 [Pseudomonadota bacterium]
MDKDTFRLWVLLLREQLAKSIVKHLPTVILRQCFLYSVAKVVVKTKKRFSEVTVKDVLNELEG